MTNTLKPLEQPFEPAIETILANYPQQDGYLLALFRTFAHSERFLKTCIPNLLDQSSPLDLRTREITILRVTSNRNCEYEWGVHVTIFSNAAGLSVEQIAATRHDNPECWQPKERRLLEVVDQLCATSTLNEKTLVEFQTDWNQEEQLEIIALCGTYSTISLVANVARLPLETFSAKFPMSL